MSKQSFKHFYTDRCSVGWTYRDQNGTTWGQFKQKKVPKSSNSSNHLRLKIFQTHRVFNPLKSFGEIKHTLTFGHSAQCPSNGIISSDLIKMRINTWPLTFLLIISTRWFVYFRIQVATLSCHLMPDCHCQTLFESVSCFNLLNLIFPQLSDSFPQPRLPAPHWNPPPTLADRATWPPTSSYFGSYRPSLTSFEVFHPCSPYHVTVSSFSASFRLELKSERRLFFFPLVIFGGASRRSQRGR